jgi:hypothetical protein
MQGENLRIDEILDRVPAYRPADPNEIHQNNRHNRGAIGG